MQPRFRASKEIIGIECPNFATITGCYTGQQGDFSPTVNTQAQCPASKRRSFLSSFCFLSSEKGSTIVAKHIAYNLDETMLKFELLLSCNTTLWHAILRPSPHQLLCKQRNWTFRVNGLCSHTNGPLSSQQHHAICGLDRADSRDHTRSKQDYESSRRPQ